MFHRYGRLNAFDGPIATVKCYEDNSKVREALAEPGNGRVLVVDGGGSQRRALLGDMLGELAVKNGWKGIVINGCIRDSMPSTSSNSACARSAPSR
jgi:regulator of ribonuclease activity A